MKYGKNAIRDFSSKGADYFLVALAYQDNYSIVTHEIEAGKDAKRIKIPNVCKELGINCINVADLLKKERVRFILDNASFKDK